MVGELIHGIKIPLQELQLKMEGGGLNRKGVGRNGGIIPFCAMSVWPHNTYP